MDFISNWLGVNIGIINRIATMEINIALYSLNGRKPPKDSNNNHGL